MKNVFFVIWISVFMVSCAASIGVEVTAENNQVDRPRYSFVVPPNAGWHILTPRSFNELAILTKKKEGVIYKMVLRRNNISGAKEVRSSARAVSNEFQDFQKNRLNRTAADTGKFEMKEFKKGEMVLGSKTFYTMHYIKDTGRKIEKTSEFFYFPAESNNQYFIVVSYIELFPSKMESVESFEDEFFEAIKTISFR